MRLAARCFSGAASLARPSLPPTRHVLVARRHLTPAATSTARMTILDELDAWDSSPPRATSSKSVQAQAFASSHGMTSSKSSKGKARASAPPAGRTDVPSRILKGKAAAKSSFPASLLASYIDALPPSAPGISSPAFPSLTAYPSEELQDEVRLWGFRSSNDRAALMATLRRVWEALLERRGGTTADLTSDTEEELVISLAQQQQDEEGEADGIHILSPSSSVTSDPSGDEELGSLPLPGQPVLLTPHHSAILRRSITEDEQLYQRVLLMEPIPFEEVWSLVQRDLAASLGAGAGRTPLDFVLATEVEEEDSGSASDNSDTPLALGSAKRKSATSKSPTKKKKTSRRKDSRRRKKPLVSRDSSMQGIKGRLTEEVKAWLDLRGITWYEGDLVGPRTRHA